MIDIKEVLLLWFIKCFYKNSADRGVTTLANKSSFNNEQLVEKLYKPIIKKSKRRTVYSSFQENIWGDNLADMQSIRKLNKGFRFSLCVIGIFSKYAEVVPLKDKKGLTIANTFQNVLDKSGPKPKKIRLDIWSEFKNRFCKKLLKDDDIEIYSK